MKFNIPQINDKFVFAKDFKTGFNYNYLKGMKFVIKSINDYVTIKIISPMDECRPAMELFRKRVIAQSKKELKDLQYSVDLWNKDPKKFSVIKGGFAKGKAHCINTGFYSIPDTHPDLYGMAKRNKEYKCDSIMTHDYKHKDGLLNKYSYQTGYNEYYSKDCYEFIILGEIKGYHGLEFFETPSKELDKYLYKMIIEKQSFTIKSFMKGSFKSIK